VVTALPPLREASSSAPGKGGRGPPVCAVLTGEPLGRTQSSRPGRAAEPTGEARWEGGRAARKSREAGGPCARWSGGHTGRVVAGRESRLTEARLVSEQRSPAGDGSRAEQVTADRMGEGMDSTRTFRRKALDEAEARSRCSPSTVPHAAREERERRLVAATHAASTRSRAPPAPVGEEAMPVQRAPPGRAVGARTRPHARIAKGASERDEHTFSSIGGSTRAARRWPAARNSRPPYSS
jgi:hypothetical protein